MLAPTQGSAVLLPTTKFGDGSALWPAAELGTMRPNDRHINDTEEGADIGNYAKLKRMGRVCKRNPHHPHRNFGGVTLHMPVFLEALRRPVDCHTAATHRHAR